MRKLDFETFRLDRDLILAQRAFSLIIAPVLGESKAKSLGVSINFWRTSNFSELRPFLVNMSVISKEFRRFSQNFETMTYDEKYIIMETYEKELYSSSIHTPRGFESYELSNYTRQIRSLPLFDEALMVTRIESLAELAEDLSLKLDPFFLILVEIYMAMRGVSDYISGHDSHDEDKFKSANEPVERAVFNMLQQDTSRATKYDFIRATETFLSQSRLKFDSSKKRVDSYDLYVTGAMTDDEFSKYEKEAVYFHLNELDNIEHLLNRLEAKLLLETD